MLRHGMEPAEYLYALCCGQSALALITIFYVQHASKSPPPYSSKDAYEDHTWPKKLEV
jgi:hypothetical protein